MMTFIWPTLLCWIEFAMHEFINWTAATPWRWLVRLISFLWAFWLAQNWFKCVKTLMKRFWSSSSPKFPRSHSKSNNYISWTEFEIEYNFTWQALIWRISSVRLSRSNGRLALSPAHISFKGKHYCFIIFQSFHLFQSWIIGSFSDS